MPDKNKSDLPDGDDGNQDDALVPTLTNPELSYDPRIRKLQEVRTKLPNLTEDNADIADELIRTDVPVSEVVEIIKERSRRPTPSQDDGLSL